MADATKRKAMTVMNCILICLVFFLSSKDYGVCSCASERSERLAMD